MPHYRSKYEIIKTSVYGQLWKSGKTVLDMIIMG